MARFAYRLPAFATDFSAAMATVASLGGMSVLHAPTGCMGNYVGFDEPDWIRSPGMTYCSTMREDETIFGNDSLLLERIRTASGSMHPPFVAIIGSPITALIGTDLDGIASLSEDETGIPTVAVDCTGFGTYQDGLVKAFGACADRFATEGDGRANVLGMDKYDYYLGEDRGFFGDMLSAKGHRNAGFMPGDGRGFFSGLKDSPLSFAVSTAGLRMCQLLKRKFGVPFGVLDYEGGGEPGRSGKRCLVIGDQVVSNYIRLFVESEFGHETDVGTLFGLERSVARAGDFRSDSEGSMMERIRNGKYDIVICDPMVGSLVPDGMKKVLLPHPAVSSKIHWNSFVPLSKVGEAIGKQMS